MTARKKQTPPPGPQTDDLGAQRSEEGEVGSQERPLNRIGNLREPPRCPHLLLAEKEKQFYEDKRKGI